MTPATAAELHEVVRARPGVMADIPHVVDSWLQSFRKHSPEAERIPGPVYFKLHGPLVRGLLESGGLTVACSADDASQILGWMAWRHQHGQRVLHYLYTKLPFRGFGLEPLLLSDFGPARGGWYTHRTRHMDAVAQRLGLTFNPYLLGGPL